MLNGKFYTGLPPNMEERQGGSRHNRQQSHFFWPNDTQVDSAVETRVKRRSSLQLESVERPPLSRQLSAAHEPEVDTRHRFHQEFANSSIQFYDNLQQPQQQSANNRTVPMLRRGTRREVTPKLTAVQPSALPNVQESAEQELLTAANRQQAYSSKIQFYDYVNEAAEQNNARKPKMDMNDKREMELNTKNSPKLQVKRNVRNLSVEPVITKKPLNDAARLDEQQPKRILKQRSDPYIEQSAGVDLDYDVDVGMRQLRLRAMPPAGKKHVTYNEQADEYAYYDERRERPLDVGFGNDYARARPQLIEGWREAPNMRTGSGQQRQQKQQQQQRPYVETSRSSSSSHSHSTKSLNNNNNINKNTHSYYVSNKTTAYNNNNNSSSNNNNAHEKILPKSTVTTRRRSNDTNTDQQQQQQVESEPLLLAGDPRKHLRSSLCFNGDALVVDSSTAAPTSTSSSSSSAAQRRSARSSAMQRVSVGLPD